jgi:hypothetical protein
MPFLNSRLFLKMNYKDMKHKPSRYESKPMTRFWATNQKINSESDENMVSVMNKISQ